MKSIKGTKTELNLKKALQGESLARNRYTFFAEQARKEGEEDLAKLYERLAANEMMHAKLWFKLLNDGMGDLDQNLTDAAKGEQDEWRTMYPAFADQAREEGLDEVADMILRVASIEKDHEKTLLMKAIERAGAKQEQDAPIVRREVPGYRCMFCGAVFETRQDVCPVCEAIGAFEATTLLV